MLGMPAGEWLDQRLLYWRGKHLKHLNNGQFTVQLIAYSIIGNRFLESAFEAIAGQDAVLPRVVIIDPPLMQHIDFCTSVIAKNSPL